MNTQRFEKICRYGQKNLKKYLVKALSKQYDQVQIGDGYVYAQGDFPVLLTAHMDTVHANVPSKISYTQIKDGTAMSCKEGIGGDDRCGIYMILELIKHHKCSVLFCEDEEIGGVGSEKFVKTSLAKSLKDTFCYILELDRKGNTDAVFYECDNDEFEDFIMSTDYYHFNWGTFSDICTLGPALNAASVNLSCGYYNAHTKNEYVILEDMWSNIIQIEKLLDATDTEKKFEHVPARYNSYYGSNWWGSHSSKKTYAFDDYSDPFYYSDTLQKTNKCFEKQYTGESIYYFSYINDDNRLSETGVTAYTIEEAVGSFLMEHPDICYNDIYDISEEEDYTWVEKDTSSK